MYKSYSELGNQEQDQENKILYSVTEILSPQHKNNIITKNNVVCIDIYADWCVPCKQSEPIYALLAEKYCKSGQCDVVKENHDKGLSPDVTALPTYHFYLNGKKTNDVTVGANIPEVEKTIQKLLGMAEANISNNVPQYGKNSSIRNYR